MTSKDETVFVAGGTGMVGASSSGGSLLRGTQTLPVTTTPQTPIRSFVIGHPLPLDLTHQRETEQFFESARPRHVYLAAARVGGILANETYQLEFIYDNIMIATNVINAAYRYGAIKLLNLGSSCIYPKFAAQPMKEEYLLTGPLEPTNEAYAIAKIAAIKLCRYFNEQYGTNFLSVMPTNLYGQYDNFNLETAHVLPALIRKFHLAKLLRAGDFHALRADLRAYALGLGLDDRLRIDDNGSIRSILESAGITSEYVMLWGSGEPYREFLHVDDLAAACVFLMDRYNSDDLGEFLNVGAGEDMPIKELALLIKETVGFEGSPAPRHHEERRDAQKTFGQQPG